MTAERIVNLDDFGPDTTDDAVITLQLLVMMHNETHKRWRIAPHPGGSWNYEKA